MTKERFFVEINDENAVYDDDTLKVTLPRDKQSCEGVNFYSSKDIIITFKIKKYDI